MPEFATPLGVEATGPARSIVELEYSPIGNFLATRRANGEVNVWQTGTQTLSHTWTPDAHAISDLCFSADGLRVFVATGTDGNVLENNLHTGESSVAVAFPATKIHSLLPSRLIFCNRRSYGACELPCQSPQRLNAFGRPAIPLCVADDGSCVIGKSKINNSQLGPLDQLLLLDLRTKQQTMLDSFSSSPAVADVMTYGSERQIFVGCHGSGQVAILRLEGRRWQKRWLGPHRSEVVDLDTSPDGRFLAVATQAGSIRVWETLTGRAVFDFLMLEHPATAVRFSPDGRQLASAHVANNQHGVWLWDFQGRIQSLAGEQGADSELTWALLGEMSAAKAYGAAATFLKSPEKTLAFFRGKLEDWIRVPEADLVQQRVSELSSLDFGTRQTAYRQLLDWRNLIRSQLKTALQKSKSVESRLTIRRILSHPETGGNSNPRLMRQSLRVLYVLEQIADKEATQLISRISQGHPNLKVREVALRAMSGPNTP